jgi:hypothetical protein
VKDPEPVAEGGINVHPSGVAEGGGNAHPSGAVEGGRNACPSGVAERHKNAWPGAALKGGYASGGGPDGCASLNNCAEEPCATAEGDAHRGASTAAGIRALVTPPSQWKINLCTK